MLTGTFTPSRAVISSRWVSYRLASYPLGICWTFRPQALVRHVIVIDRRGADHAFIGQAQAIDRPFWIVGQPCVIARLGEGDRFDAGGIIVITISSVSSPRTRLSTT
jgi:hypothetical protein